VVWDRPVGISGSIFGQRYAHTGAPLGPEFRVNTNTTDIKGHAQVASDAAGNFVVAWHAFSIFPDPTNVYAQRYSSTGSPLGGEFRVNTSPGYHRAPSVASDAFGNVWESPFDVSAQRFSSAGTPLGSAFRVNTYTTSTQGEPRVASDSNGNFVVVWHGYYQDGSDFGVFGQRYATTGTPLGGEFQINTFTTGKQWYPSVMELVGFTVE
jgi:hypothetical protein